jgi:hypothetical protein
LIIKGIDNQSQISVWLSNHLIIKTKNPIIKSINTQVPFYRCSLFFQQSLFVTLDKSTCENLHKYQVLQVFIPLPWLVWVKVLVRRTEYIDGGVLVTWSFLGREKSELSGITKKKIYT